MFKRLLFIFFIFTTFLGAKSISIAVAANVSYAIEDLKKEFHKLYPDIKVHVTLGSSGKLTAQILHGAPYKLFMSANMKYPKMLYKKNIAITKPLIYAQGSLALLSSKKRNFSQLSIFLEDNSIKRIAVANPKTAPYGIATKEALQNLNLYKKLKYKFIYGESISQTLTYALRASDVGFIAKSSLYSPKLKYLQEGKNWTNVDTKLYTPISQGIVLLKNADVDTRNFYNFIFSKKAQMILKNFGYMIPLDR
jgi:molybdate transport system substrate-binding protein